jgi:hypothetical protein
VQEDLPQPPPTHEVSADWGCGLEVNRGVQTEINFPTESRGWGYYWKPDRWLLIHRDPTSWSSRIVLHHWMDQRWLSSPNRFGFTTCRPLMVTPDIRPRREPTDQHLASHIELSHLALVAPVCAADPTASIDPSPKSPVDNPEPHVLAP